MKNFHFVILLFSFMMIFTSNFGFDTNYAEARDVSEPCSYTKPYSYIKISQEPWECKKVDYRVPKECGIVPGSHNNPACQPPSKSTTSPNSASSTSSQNNDPDRDGIIGSNDACPNKQGPAGNSGCPCYLPKEMINGVCKTPPKPSSPSSSTTSVPGPPVSQKLEESREGMFTGIALGLLFVIALGIVIIIKRRGIPLPDDPDEYEEGYDDGYERGWRDGER